jgi:hypothetical protein
MIMRSPRHFSLRDATFLTGVSLCLLFTHEAFTVKVVPLKYSRAGEMAYTLSWVAPPSVRIAPYCPTNSLIISGHPAAVEELVDIIK